MLRWLYCHRRLCDDEVNDEEVGRSTIIELAVGGFDLAKIPLRNLMHVLRHHSTILPLLLISLCSRPSILFIHLSITLCVGNTALRTLAHFPHLHSKVSGQKLGPLVQQYSRNPLATAPLSPTSNPPLPRWRLQWRSTPSRVTRVSFECHDHRLTIQLMVRS